MCIPIQTVKLVRVLCEEVSDFLYTIHGDRFLI